MPFIAEIALLLLLVIVAGAALVALISLIAFLVSTIVGRKKKQDEECEAGSDQECKEVVDS